MYEWRLELLFKYAGNDLNKWQNAIWSKIQTYDGNWGIITYVDNNRFIMDVHNKDIHINFSEKIVQFSWHELHYNFKDIEFSPILLENLYEYFNSQNCDVYLNPRSYKLLEEEYQNFEQHDQMEQRSFDEETIERIESDLLNDDDFLNSDEYERELSNFLSSDDYLDSADNHRKYLEEEYFNHQSIPWEDELDDFSQDPSYLLGELEKLLSKLKFREADDYYYYECSEYLSLEAYQNKRNLFLPNLKQSLFSQLEKLLSGFEFHEADSYYYHECSEYISYEVYQNKRNQFLQNLKQSLFLQLEDLFIQDDYKNADKFYADACSEYINTEEYHHKKKLFGEKKRTSLLEELNKLFEKDFLVANDFYQNHCFPFISPVEY